MDKEKNFVSAVIYVYNNEKEIDTFFRKLADVLEKNFLKYEIICVNDASTDSSVKLIKEVVGNYVNAPLTIIEMSSFHGIELSMNAGIDLAIGDFVFEFDSTVLDYSDTLIMEVYNKSLEGYDVVSAVPKQGNSTSSKGFYRLFNNYSNSNYKMQTERFRILSRRLINRVGAANKVISYRKIAYANSGLPMSFITYPLLANKQLYRNKEEKEYRMKLALDSFVLFTDIGYRFSMGMTGLMMIITLLAALYAVIIFCTGSPVAGWTTTIIFLSIAFFGIFGLFSIIIKYLDILVDLSSIKQRYSVRSIEKISK